MSQIKLNFQLLTCAAQSSVYIDPDYCVTLKVEHRPDRNEYIYYHRDKAYRNRDKLMQVLQQQQARESEILIKLLTKEQSTNYGR